ncbi:MAG: helix-hairpin-helix domain-containing protein [Candidatus Omnitrophota bacterium]|jgi:comEA protein
MSLTPKTTKTLGMLLAALAVTGTFTVLNAERLHAAQIQEEAKPAQALKVVNINQASAEELLAVRGIGPSTAERIVKFRNENGPFVQIEALGQVRGIGQAKLEKMKSQISI